jgi:photosystem II stability/assembly factor-like uncharacterized protein
MPKLVLLMNCVKIVSTFCFTFLSVAVFSQSEIKNSFLIDTLITGKFSCRALLIDSKKVWYATNHSTFGYLDLETKKQVTQKIEFDSLEYEFRSIAQTKKHLFIATISNPGIIFKIDKQTLEYLKVYEERHEKVFFDSMQFYDEKFGIAIGDPTSDCISVVITHDGGTSWKKLSCEQLPKTAIGEAAFAASNSNVKIIGNSLWIASGGIKSRVFYSNDKGKTWQDFDTPIIQGKEMTGIFTMDFYNKKLGMVAGGNYENLQSNIKNKAITLDGGKSWQLISENKGFGYSSCVQFFPKSKGKKILSVGATGIYYSKDRGKNWRLISTDASLYTARFVDKNTVIASGKDKVIRIIIN